MIEEKKEYVPFDFGFIPFQIDFINNLTEQFPGLKFLDISYNKINNSGLDILLQNLNKK